MTWEFKKNFCFYHNLKKELKKILPVILLFILPTTRKKYMNVNLEIGIPEERTWEKKWRAWDISEYRDSKPLSLCSAKGTLKVISHYLSILLLATWGSHIIIYNHLHVFYWCLTDISSCSSIFLESVHITFLMVQDIAKFSYSLLPNLLSKRKSKDIYSES